MNKMVVILIALSLIGLISGECFMYNATSGEGCESRATGEQYCCLVEYRTNRDPNYYKVCVPLEAEYIEDGIFEDAIKVIESGYFNSSYWNNTIFELFQDYASIAEFDCKANYLPSVLILANIFLILFLI